MQRVAVVTGASSGIGAATAIRLAAPAAGSQPRIGNGAHAGNEPAAGGQPGTGNGSREPAAGNGSREPGGGSSEPGTGAGAATASGFHVVLAARRADRVEDLAKRIRAAGGSAEARLLDVTDRSAVDQFASELPRCDVLVNNAGGAIGVEEIADADPADWRAMFEVNVLGTLNVTQALLPGLIASGDGTIVVMSSTAGFVAYEGGGGYVAAKHGVHAIAATLRLELAGQPVRVIEIAPGMVRTDEFSLNRFRGDADRADGVYAGVREPLTADDIADTIAWTVTRPAHVNVDLLVIRPRAQAAQHKVHREM